MSDLRAHLEALSQCRQCSGMTAPPITCGPVTSKVILVGQAPGAREPELGKPFAWTAGKTLFGWFSEHCGIEESRFRETIYISAVCRCFPGKAKSGGDRVPSRDEIETCSEWLNAEFALLEPELVIPVGRLAISRFLEFGKLTEVVGQKHSCLLGGRACEVIPLPHPSGASTWHRSDPGRGLTTEALSLLAQHPAMRRAAG